MMKQVKNFALFCLLLVSLTSALRAEVSDPIQLPDAAFVQIWHVGAEIAAEDNEFLTGSGKKKALSAQEALGVIYGYLGALKEHDIPKSYYAFTSASFRKSTPWENYRQFIFNNPVLLQNRSADFKEPIPQEKMFIFKGTLTSLTNDVNTVEIALVTENDQWKILGIKVYPKK